jgi:hypothetical protein
VPRYAQGQPVSVSTTVTLVDGTPVDPTTIRLRVRMPDGSMLPDYNAPARDSIGQFHQDLDPADLSLLGSYQYAWVTTGAGAGVSPAAGFSVVDPFAPTHISFDDARKRLGLRSASDDEVQDMMASAVAEQEHSVGAVAPRQVTETVTAFGGRLWLSTRPVLEVLSATTVAGAPVSTSGWRVGSEMAGSVGSVDGPIVGTLVVTYTAGRNPVPQDLVEAALLRVQHSYETQRGPAELPLADAAEGGGASFLLMLRAREKEAPYALPVIA